MSVEITDYRGLAAQAVTALHMHSHAGINKPGFDECHTNLCGDWHRLEEGPPPVLVPRALAESLLELLSDYSTIISGAYVHSIITALSELLREDQ